MTGAQGHAIQVRDAVDRTRRPQDRIVLGNWADETLLAGERSIQCWPTTCWVQLTALPPITSRSFFRGLTAQRLYVVGLEPYVTAEPTTTAGKLVWEIVRFRDACLLLAGEQPYREYLAQWVADQLHASGFRVTAAHRFAIRYKQRFVNSQIDMCAPRLAKIASRSLAETLLAEGERLRARAIATINEEGGLSHGYDYVFAAVPV